MITLEDVEDLNIKLGSERAKVREVHFLVKACKAN